VTLASSPDLADLPRRLFNRNTLLPLQPNSLWRLEWGTVRTLTWGDSGAAVALGYWGPGSVVGTALSHLQPYQIECVTSVEAVAIPIDYRSAVLNEIVETVQRTEELLTIVRYERIYQRLQHLLTWLAGKFGRSVPTGELIDLRLTHQAIAELVGTTRVTVTRLLKELEEAGEIHRQQRHYIILRNYQHPTAK